MLLTTEGKDKKMIFLFYSVYDCFFLFYTLSLDESNNHLNALYKEILYDIMI